jgi:hypothetical protein
MDLVQDQQKAGSGSFRSTQETRLTAPVVTGNAAADHSEAVMSDFVISSLLNLFVQRHWPVSKEV